MFWRYAHLEICYIRLGLIVLDHSPTHAKQAQAVCASRNSNTELCRSLGITDGPGPSDAEQSGPRSRNMQTRRSKTMGTRIVFGNSIKVQYASVTQDYTVLYYYPHMGAFAHDLHVPYYHPQK